MISHILVTRTAAMRTFCSVALAILFLAAALPGLAAEPKPWVREIKHANGALASQWQVKLGEDGRELRHGRYMRFHENGYPALEAWYKDDNAVGIWTWWDDAGNLLRSVEYEYGVPVPLRGESLNDPVFAFTQLNGRKTAEGLLKGEKPHGRWTFWYPTGSPRAEGDYLTGIPQGRWNYYFPNGQIERQARFELGILHGEFREAHENGQEARTGRMDQGLKVGRWRYWYANGQIQSEGEFAGDRQEGEWRFWNEQGALVRRVLFRNGAPAQELAVPARPNAWETAEVTTETDIRPMPMLSDEQGELIRQRER